MSSNNMKELMSHNRKKLGPPLIPSVPFEAFSSRLFLILGERSKLLKKTNASSVTEGLMVTPRLNLLTPRGEFGGMDRSLFASDTIDVHSSSLLQLQSLRETKKIRAVLQRADQRLHTEATDLYGRTTLYKERVCQQTDSR